MAFLGNLVRTLLSSQGPSEDAVQDVAISRYIHIPIIMREDCLVLYGPTISKKYDLLLQKPVEASCTTAFSLFRVSDSCEAQMRFLAIKEVFLPLIQAMPQEFLQTSVLQKTCDLMRQNPAWTVAHIAAYLGFLAAFSNPHVKKMSDTAEIKEKLTPLHLAVQREDIKMITTILELGVSVDVTDINGNSIFHTASTTNSNIIKVVTVRQSTLLNAQNNDGKTPLHLSCEGDKPECVKALLVAGADVNVAATHSASLPIHSAITADSTLCAKEIIDMYPNQLYKEDMKHGGTPLHWATSRLMINALVGLGCNVNACNFNGSTALHNMVQHNRLACVVAILSWGIQVNLKNKDGNTAAHLSPSPPILQALLVFGADPTVTNNKGETVRHVIATCSLKEKKTMLYHLHAVGGARCSSQMPTCSDGCSPLRNYDGEPPPVNPMARTRSSYDAFLDDALDATSRPLGFEGAPSKGGRILCLDGGGLKGLVLIQLLAELEREAQVPITHLFDWICGTSTGGILALALAMGMICAGMMERGMEATVVSGFTPYPRVAIQRLCLLHKAGKDPRHCQGLYFRMKDAVFVGQRPYSEKPLEEILKKEFGESTCMSDITGLKVAVSGVLADRFPADLHLFRNYVGGEDLLNASTGVTDSPVFTPVQLPQEQLVWQAARASGAAPSYFSAFGRFVDGGLIANNPTLDMMTEVNEYNAVLRALGRGHEAEPIGAVLSLGTGKPPVSKVNAIDIFRPESFFKTIQMAFGLSSMAKLLIDQATMADNRTVDRARAWAGMCGVPYLRLSPQLSLDMPLDETRDDLLINMLWETLVYAHDQRHKLRRMLHILKPQGNEGC